MSVDNPSIQVGSITAYRCWHANKDHLASFNNHEWPHKQPLQSKCGHNYCAPAIDCSCGIYAFNTYDEMLDQVEPINRSRYIYGELSLWGTVHIHNRGYRAQYAYPTKLYLFDARDEPLYTKLAVAYDIIIEKVTTPITTTLPRYPITMTLKQRSLLTSAINIKRAQLAHKEVSNG